MGQLLDGYAQVFSDIVPIMLNAVVRAATPMIPVFALVYGMKLMVFVYNFVLDDSDHTDEDGYDGYVENMFDMAEYDDDNDNLSLW